MLFLSSIPAAERFACTSPLGKSWPIQPGLRGKRTSMFLSRCELGPRLPGLQALLLIYHQSSSRLKPSRLNTLTSTRTRPAAPDIAPPDAAPHPASSPSPRTASRPPEALPPSHKPATARPAPSRRLHQRGLAIHRPAANHHQPHILRPRVRDDPVRIMSRVQFAFPQHHQVRRMPRFQRPNLP